MGLSPDFLSGLLCPFVLSSGLSGLGSHRNVNNPVDPSERGVHDLLIEVGLSQVTATPCPEARGSFRTSSGTAARSSLLSLLRRPQPFIAWRLSQLHCIPRDNLLLLVEFQSQPYLPLFQQHRRLTWKWRGIGKIKSQRFEA